MSCPIGSWRAGLIDLCKTRENQRGGRRERRASMRTRFCLFLEYFPGSLRSLRFPHILEHIARAAGAFSSRPKFVIGGAAATLVAAALLSGCAAPRAEKSAPAEHRMDISRIPGLSTIALTPETAFPPVRTAPPVGAEVSGYGAMLRATAGMEPGKVAAGRRVEMELRKPKPPYEDRLPLPSGPVIEGAPLPRLPWPSSRRGPEPG